MAVDDILSTAFGANDITVVKTANYEQNSYLENLNKHSLQEPIKFAEKQQSQMTDLKNILNYAKNNKIKEAQDNEKEPKKFKKIQEYGAVLEKIEKLIGIISFDFEDLSFAELGKEIEKLLKARNTNTAQITYSFYQELFVSTTDSLVVIESAFENGEITADDALAQIKSLKLDFKSNLCEVPATFNESKNDVEHLLNMYEQAFSTAKAPAFTVISNPFQINPAVKIQLQNLNEKTLQLQKSTEQIYKKVSEFDPVVNLGPLCQQVTDCNTFFMDDWDLDTASYKVRDLSSLTDNLYNEQVEKNEYRSNLSAEIKNLTVSTTELTKKTKEEVTLRQCDQSNTRARAILDRLPNLKQMLDGGTSSLPENLATQLANCYTCVVDKDRECSIAVATKNEMHPTAFDENLNTLTYQEIDELKAYIAELSNERSPKLYKAEEDEEDQDKQK